jgi:hypothetical protein
MRKPTPIARKLLTSVRLTPILLASMLLGAPSAFAGSTSGNTALALAALVGTQSPELEAQQKEALGSMLDSKLNFAFPADKKITVKADSVVCRASNVNVASSSCEITFGKRKVSRSGRAAHELYATLNEAGVTPEGAAGSMYAGISKLSCTVDPNTIKGAAGGGAECTFSPGP